MWIVLIGLRGCGKTTVARQLGDMMSVPVTDLDEIVRATFDNRSVQDIFDHDGEPAWRAAEVSSLVTLLGEAMAEAAAPAPTPTSSSTPPVATRILSLGGGTPMQSGAARTLRDAAARGAIVIIHLAASVEIRHARLSAKRGDRPALTAASSLAEEMGMIQKQRDPVYRRLADRVVETDVTSEVVSTARRVLAAVMSVHGEAVSRAGRSAQAKSSRDQPSGEAPDEVSRESIRSLPKGDDPSHACD